MIGSSRRTLGAGALRGRLHLSLSSGSLYRFPQRLGMVSGPMLLPSMRTRRLVVFSNESSGASPAPGGSPDPSDPKRTENESEQKGRKGSNDKKPGGVTIYECGVSLYRARIGA